MEEAARELAKHLCNPLPEILYGIRDPLADLQVQLNSSTIPMPIRELDSHVIGRLVRVPGIVVSASVITSKPTSVCIVCRNCKTERQVAMPLSGGFSMPRVCPGPQGETDVRQQRCPMDPFSVVASRCRCVDQQTLKVQEAPEAVPVGELPRQVLVVVDRTLVNKISPGTRIIVNGVYSIFGTNVASSTRKNGVGSSAAAVRTPYIRLLGYEIVDGKLSTEVMGFMDGISGGTHEKITGPMSDSELAAFSRQPDLYKRFAQSIAPSIFGHDDVKRAIACMLFGGSRKVLPDGIRLRGDINVLMLGDPGVAKSQFLKFVERVAPISVYTSGKGSSAAGLTASVVRDPGSGEFYLEGGAMVLADGGVVCIDEFDKMDNEDRVAIHEAMEQQTISIAKAGITTILNSRTSVLAAANPVFGRYDEMRTPGENIDFSSTILSRFDAIFILKDEHNRNRDITLARHVLSVHMNASDSHGDNQEGTGRSEDFDLATMKRYISACKSNCAPRLSAAAAEKLGSHYVALRSQVHQMEEKTSERSTIPITVRQLEAIIRIAEALAKMTCSPIASEIHVDEALRLFRVSTMQAVISGHYALEGINQPEIAMQIERVEKVLRARLPVGSSASYRSILRDLVETKKFPQHAVVRAIDGMVQQEKILLRSQGKLLIRQR